MRWPFFDPSKDEIAAVACDLITRFGLQSHDEALRLAEVAANIGARKNLQLYRLAAREIQKSFAEARVRLNVRLTSASLRRASGGRRLAGERDGGAEPADPRQGATRH